MKSLTFDGIKKDWLYLLQGRRKAPFAPLNHDFIYIPRMKGAHLSKTDTGLMTITQPIGFVVQDDADALAKKDELASWLVKEGWSSLEFDDEPNRTYNAVIKNTIDDFEKFVELREGTITFICQPYADGEEITVPVNESFNYGGTAPTLPSIEVNFSASASSFEVSNQDGLKIKVNYGFQSGDKLNINFETQKIMINDVVQMTAFAWKVSDWFEVKPGSNTLTTSHNAQVTIVERWK